jgi:hypothetical protein
MEGKTMFDLNEQISQWRTSLSQSQTCRQSDIDELENHLREEIENLTASQLSEQEAFWIAAHRLGDTNALAGEFAKTNKGTVLGNRLCWMAVGLLLYLILNHLAGAASKGFVFLSIISGIRGYYVGILSLLLTGLVLFITVLLFYKVFRRNITGSILGEWANTLKGKIFIVTSLLVMLVALNFAGTLSFVRATRIVGARESGKIIMIPAVVSNLAVPILFPIILMILLIRLRGSKFNTMGT